MLTISRVIQRGPPVTLDFRGMAVGGAARLDITGGSDAARMPAGSCVLISDTSGAARLVDSVHRRVHLLGAGARLGGLVELHIPPGRVSDVAVTLDTLGAGDVIEGHATRRYRITTCSALALTLREGRVATAQSSSVTALWHAEWGERIPNPFLGPGGDDTPGDFLAPLNRALVETGRRLSGVTLRRETHASLAARGIPFTQQDVTTQTSGLRPAVVDPITLRVPSEFTTSPD
jgi:hypothetical protein